MNTLILPLTAILPYENNPRVNAAVLAPLKASIERYGYNVPIVVDPAHVIIAGHSRYQALVELGYTEALVIVSEMSPEKAREWRLVDNKASEQAQWDRDKLITELRSVESGMDAFFASNELAQLLGGLESIKPREVTAAEVARVATSMDNHFTDNLTKRLERTITVTCAHCGKTFGFDRPTANYHL